MLQTAFNGLITGIIMTLPALAVTLLFGVLKFPNFAVGAMMTCAAYMVFALNAQLGWPLLAATGVVAIVFGGVCKGAHSRPTSEEGKRTITVRYARAGHCRVAVTRPGWETATKSFKLRAPRARSSRAG